MSFSLMLGLNLGAMAGTFVTLVGYSVVASTPLNLSELITPSATASCAVSLLFIAYNTQRHNTP